MYFGDQLEGIDHSKVSADEPLSYTIQLKEKKLPHIVLAMYPICFPFVLSQQLGHSLCSGFTPLLLF